MTDDTMKAMKKARTESKRALKAIEALLEYYFDGHAMDRAEASRSCLDALVCALNVEIRDYEWHKNRKFPQWVLTEAAKRGVIKRA